MPVYKYCLMKSFLFPLLCLVFSGCYFPEKPKKITDQELNELSESEAMHYSIKRIIYDVHSFRPDDFNKKFLKSPVAHPLKDIISMYGEVHSEPQNIIDNISSINYFAHNRDLLLQEGGDYKTPLRKCEGDLFFHAYVAERWEKLNRPYEPNEKYWLRTKLKPIYRKIEKTLDFSGLTLPALHCGYWDNLKLIDRALEDSEVRKYSLGRNKYMVKAMNRQLGKYRKIFLIAGYSHLPIGELLESLSASARANEHPQREEEYFELVKKERSRGESRVISGSLPYAGSTEPIYRFYKDNALRLGQYIPVRNLR